MSTCDRSSRSGSSSISVTSSQSHSGLAGPPLTSQHEEAAPPFAIFEGWVPQMRVAGCPISRALCEKWGFTRHPPQRLSEIPTYDIRARSGLKYFYAKDLHFISASYCRKPLVGIGYPKNLLLVKIKIASHNAPNQFESPTSRKEREKWGTLRFITEKWATLHSRETLDIRSRRRRLLSTYRLSNKRRSFRFTRDRICLGSKRMANKLGLTDFRIDVWQWIKLHLRTTALEHSGPRLSYRFSFVPDPSIIVCRIYFSDDESNPISAISPTDQRNIQDGWIELAIKHC
jgi:hypothetical protein